MQSYYPSPLDRISSAYNSSCYRDELKNVSYGRKRKARAVDFDFSFSSQTKKAKQDPVEIERYYQIRNEREKNELRANYDTKIAQLQNEILMLRNHIEGSKNEINSLRNYIEGSNKILQQTEREMQRLRQETESNRRDTKESTEADLWASKLLLSISGDPPTTIKPIPQRPSFVVEETVAKPKRRRGHLPEKATNILKNWLFNHEQHPYPTEDEKQMLVKMTDLTLTQINNWFTNARRRILKNGNVRGKAHK
eukprot:TRINITY_DN9177_c0_g1_i1.p1 TRINITY_DN9177_c0_g1~~TRINITY_DN9177_c0_g1_i1.p1  ORF type:complete len:252 (+),score=41.97 TRINITY_DN9177_c0_g1_i1:63-818(+)